MAEPNDDDLALARKLSLVRTPCLELAALFAQHREQCERAAARAATLAVVERVRATLQGVVDVGWIREELDAIEREANEP